MVAMALPPYSPLNYGDFLGPVCPFCFVARESDFPLRGRRPNRLFCFPRRGVFALRPDFFFFEKLLGPGPEPVFLRDTSLASPQKPGKRPASVLSLFTKIFLPPLPPLYSKSRLLQISFPFFYQTHLLSITSRPPPKSFRPLLRAFFCRDCPIPGKLFDLRF